MSKKAKHHAAPLSPAELRARTDKAVREGRFQQALDLGKQLYKQNPSPEHRDLLRRIQLGRARQLRQQGSPRDAVTVIDNLLQMGPGEPAVLEQAAEELAACGYHRRAMELLARVPGSAVMGKVLGRAADAAVQRGPAGRDQLSPDLQGQFDLVLRAFGQLEAGQDDAARETLQGVGLQSPFLEWKLFLRGLAAFYQNDDERAIENWQRLNPDRLPARLAAPMRFRIDEAFRQAQQPQAQAVLQRQADQLQSSGLEQPLREIQKALGANELPRAFRHAEVLLPALRQQAPKLVPRLAACFYWAIIHGGEPRDIERYQRFFGTPVDDPDFARLRALVLEQMHDLQEAQEEWARFERSVAANATVWPGEQASRARSLVWCRMGHNAAGVPDPEKLQHLPRFLREHPDRPQPLRPGAEKCFQQARELAPDQVEPYEALFEFYREKEQDKKAEKAGRDLLERFPDHLPTLEALGDLLMGKERPADSLEFFQRATRVNPLDRRLRGKVSTAHIFNARAHAEKGHFDEARVEFQSALALHDGHSPASVLCKWAACEFKAGDAVRGEELLQQALAESGIRLAVAYSMLIETIRFKLPRGLKTRFDKEFKDGLAEPPTGAGAAAVADTANVHQLAGVKYHGQKTHEKKVLGYLEKARDIGFAENQLEGVCSALLGLKNVRLQRHFAARGQHEFPQNPFFYLVEAESYIALGPDRCPVYRVEPLLNKARQLAAAMPPDEKQKRLLETIQQRQQMIAIISPFGMGMDLFEDFLNQYDDDDDDDYDDDGW